MRSFDVFEGQNWQDLVADEKLEQSKYGEGSICSQRYQGWHGWLGGWLAGARRCVLVVTTAAMFCSMFHPGLSETERSPANRVGLTHCENFAIRGDRYRSLWFLRFGTKPPGISNVKCENSSWDFHGASVFVTGKVIPCDSDAEARVAASANRAVARCGVCMRVVHFGIFHTCFFEVFVWGCLGHPFRYAIAFLWHFLESFMRFLRYSFVSGWRYVRYVIGDCQTQITVTGWRHTVEFRLEDPEFFIGLRPSQAEKKSTKPRKQRGTYINWLCEHLHTSMETDSACFHCCMNGVSARYKDFAWCLDRCSQDEQRSEIRVSRQEMTTEELCRAWFQRFKIWRGRTG